MEGQFLTDRGKVRLHNEDSGGLFHNKYGQNLAIIADGMGGHQAGDVASEMATTMIENEWKNSAKMVSPEQAEKWLNETLTKINKAIYDYSLQKEECTGMGTTVVTTICLEEFVTVAHIGDSRCYMFHDQSLKQITNDHSLVNELIRSGEISKEDAQHHPRKNVVLKALGTEANVQADIDTLTWEKDDIILLCSDGLTDKVLDDELKDYIGMSLSISEIGTRLINLANERGGDDNVSLVLVKHTLPKEEGDDQC